MFIVTLIGWIVFGLVVGLIARAIFPGTQSMGLVATTVLGIVGSILGGLFGSLMSGAPLAASHPAGWIGSILGALVVLVLPRLAERHAPA